MASTSTEHSKEVAKAAKAAFEKSQLIPSSERISALQAIHGQLKAQKAEILLANEEDLKVRSSSFYP